ncbi:MAG TPA: nucleoside monophosphate kinase [Acidimicrobiia bacterium]|nr:nucleoside monophosphate kinase [Acidimicrobiia bacterium]
MRLVLLGAPGAGKGTQGVVLGRRFGVPHISSGDLLRRHVVSQSELGRRLGTYLSRGELVPDDLVLAVIGDAIIAAMRTGGYILDGFPRTLAQAEQAYALAEPAGLAADAVVYLAVPDDEARRRLAGREADRTDDADPAVIERRLRLFHAETKPLLDFYARRAILVTIDAVQSAETVSAAIFAALADREFPTAGRADGRGEPA